MGFQKSYTEIAENIYRLTIALSQKFEFSSFLILDDNPCLIHAGKLSLFEELKKMVSEVLNGKKLKYVVFSHVEGDESGAVNNWLQTFSESSVVCNKLSNMSLGESLIRPAQILKDGDVLKLGNRGLQMIETPHFPHNWDAHMWFEINDKILFSSDFCCQGGITPATTEVDTSDEIISFYDQGGFIPYGKTTNKALAKIEQCDFRVVAPMHGSVISKNISWDVFQKVKKDLISRS